ncbi:hypothetical protein H310_12315 [Aphanomyces invadans]|uniref:Uncharacterized protein n=1 Tax=Aphanomyces invadans TaxID=157072 RepID=A0A024TIB2_9STRA|nr:hypothetical protein H310_12315 [Aphanomyces invadans]ETV93739.1 hypothetical protein H310_12315 [Aphanomyces invadans]|eukprot:XP_008877548.1 hypothetical protein H310_12315 [Aphanomyces invadans]
MSDSEFLPSAEVAVNQVSRSHLIVLDDDPVARMECSPVVDMLPGESKEDLRRRCEAMVKAILVAKVEDARSLGLRDEEVVRLKQLQAKFVDTREEKTPKPRNKAFKLTNFGVGDYVLVGSVVRYPSKLSPAWRASAPSSRACEPFLPSEVVQRGSERHGEDLEDHAAYGEGGFHVEDLLATRVVNGQHEILEDVPVQLRKWVLSQKHDDGVEAMQEALELTLGHLL